MNSLQSHIIGLKASMITKRVRQTYSAFSSISTAIIACFFECLKLCQAQRWFGSPYHLPVLCRHTWSSTRKPRTGYQSEIWAKKKWPRVANCLLLSWSNWDSLMFLWQLLHPLLSFERSGPYGRGLGCFGRICYWISWWAGWKLRR